MSVNMSNTKKYTVKRVRTGLKEIQKQGYREIILSKYKLVKDPKIMLIYKI